MLKRYDAHQLEAIQNEDKACIVKAAVGSGKTTILTEKVLYLWQNKHIPLSKMVVMTFTDKAAAEITDRIRTLQGEIGDDELQYFGTYHGIALKLLRQVTSTDITVLAPADEHGKALKLIEENKLNIRYLNKLSKRLGSTSVLYGNMKQEDDLPKLKELLSSDRKEHNLMSFNEIITEATEALGRYDFSPEYVILDEVQDTNPEQYEFIRALTRHNACLFAVGDPNQSIYGWNGADRAIFDKIRTDYSATELTLNVNHRSAKSIIKAAKRLLPDAKELETDSEEEGSAEIHHCTDGRDEAMYVAAAVAEDNVRYNSIAVLSATNAQLDIIRGAFEAAHICCGESIQLLTLNKSKGLEFDCVYITGVDDGVLPMHDIEEDPEDFAEARRLLYVGITRARKKLVLTYTKPSKDGELPYGFFIDRLLPACIGSEMTVMQLEKAEKLYAKLENRKPHEIVRPAPAKQLYCYDRKYGRGRVISDYNGVIEVDFGEHGIRKRTKLFMKLTEE